MTCEDCMLFGKCRFDVHFSDGDLQMQCIGDVEERCEGFVDKSRFVELPCKVGNTVYCFAPCFDEIYHPKLKNEEIVVEAQKIWLKMACFVLHDSFGWPEEKLNEFLASWKSMYRWNKRLGSAEKQKEAFDKCIEECFPENGYPENIIELLEKP